MLVVVGLSMDAPVWDATSFGQNGERLLDADVAQRQESAQSLAKFTKVAD